MPKVTRPTSDRAGNSTQIYFIQSFSLPDACPEPQRPYCRAQDQGDYSWKASSGGPTCPAPLILTLLPLRWAAYLTGSPQSSHTSASPRSPSEKFFSLQGRQLISRDFILSPTRTLFHYLKPKTAAWCSANQQLPEAAQICGNKRPALPGLPRWLQGSIPSF